MRQLYSYKKQILRIWIKTQTQTQLNVCIPKRKHFYLFESVVYVEIYIGQILGRICHPLVEVKVGRRVSHGRRIACGRHRIVLIGVVFAVAAYDHAQKRGYDHADKRDKQRVDEVLVHGRAYGHFVLVCLDAVLVYGYAGVGAGEGLAKVGDYQLVAAIHVYFAFGLGAKVFAYYHGQFGVDFGELVHRVEYFETVVHFLGRGGVLRRRITRIFFHFRVRRLRLNLTKKKQKMQ